MKDFIKNNWVNGLGITFLFTAFLYFLKIAIDNDWLPPAVRAVSGVVLGVSCLFLGFAFFRKEKNTLAETFSGVGIALFYATLSYVSFSESIMWSYNAMLIAMVAISIVTGWVAVKSNRRILYNLATIGGLITPLILQVPETQDVMLFVYLLIINVTALYVGSVKKWQELKVISFLSSLVIYATYYFMFDPVNWERPFFYISAFFLVYVIGITASVWQKNRDQNELSTDQFLSLLNAINFVFWANFILGDFTVSHMLPMLIVGTLFLGLGSWMFFSRKKELNKTNGLYLGLGILILAVACSDTGLVLQNGLHYVLNSGIWLVLILTTFLFGKHSKNQHVLLSTYVGFFLLTIYWNTVAWNVEWVSLWGIPYIPFLNAGALVWMGLAFLGFWFSIYEAKNQGSNLPIKAENRSTILAVISHLIVGGLLTIQISNLWKAYDIIFLDKSLVISICWMVYALTIFLWNKYSENAVFRYFGAVVLIITSLKVFFLDLSGAATFQKVVFLVIVGALTLLIGRMSRKGKESS